MTDLALDSNNDLYIFNGDLVLLQTEEELVRQRLLNKLRAFTGTLFTNIDYGINVTLFFSKGSKDLLDQEIKTLISNTEGVISLVEFTSTIDLDRVYNCSFRYSINTGEIVGINDLNISDYINVTVNQEGIWLDGVWNNDRVWLGSQVWGGTPSLLPSLWVLTNNVINADGIIYENNVL